MIRVLCLICFLFLISTNKSFAISFGTYNIRNYNYDERLKTKTNNMALVQMIDDLSVDLLAVQEIVEKDLFEEFITGYFPNYRVALSDCGGQHRQHLGFVYNPRKLNLVEFYDDMRVGLGGCYDNSRPAAVGYFQVIDFNSPLYGEYIVALSVHLKSGGKNKSYKKRERQYMAISEIIDENKEQGFENFLVLGDFNTTDYVLNNSNTRTFLDFVHMNAFDDLSQGVGCTSYWWGGVDDGLEYSSHLDHMLISQEMKRSLEITQQSAHGHCDINLCEASSKYDLGQSFLELSDHCPLTAR